MGIERMPRECIPQNELLCREPKLHQSFPDDCRSELGKPRPIFLRFARSLWSDVGKEIARLDPGDLLSPEQNSLRGHGNPAEMTAAVPKRLPHDCESRLSQSQAKI